MITKNAQLNFKGLKYIKAKMLARLGVQNDDFILYR